MRAELVKAELADTEKMKLKLEKKDEDTKELKRLLKLKVSCWDAAVTVFNFLSERREREWGERERETGGEGGRERKEWYR